MIAPRMKVEPARRWDRETALVAQFAACVSFISFAYYFQHGGLLLYGDAVAHINIARRVFDSQTPGLLQLGTVWLPLPHLLMIPLVRNDRLWQTGLAGAITSGACMTIAATFLFAAIHRLFTSATAAIAGVAVFLLNPNALYLGSIPMTESVFFAALTEVVEKIDVQEKPDQVHSMVWLSARDCSWISLSM